MVFERAYSQAPLTPFARHDFYRNLPQFHTVTDFGHPAAGPLAVRPEILKKSGYHTGAFIGSLILDPKASMAPGFDRGFDVFEAGFHPKHAPDEGRYETVERRAGDVVQRAITWLNKATHRLSSYGSTSYDPHAPYDPPRHTTRV